MQILNKVFFSNSQNLCNSGPFLFSFDSFLESSVVLVAVPKLLQINVTNSSLKNMLTSRAALQITFLHHVSGFSKLSLSYTMYRLDGQFCIKFVVDIPFSSTKWLITPWKSCSEISIPFSGQQFQGVV